MNIELFRSLPDKGFKLFPVIPGGKTPAVEGWQDRATSSWDRLDWLLKGKYNAGIFTGRFQDGEALLVIDCDRKGTKNGEAFLAVAFDPLPDTFTVRTPSGGKHLYFRTTKKFPNSVEALGPGVDIRSQGGYVVAPGSSTPDGEYTIVSDAPVAYAPQWLEDLIPPPHTPSSRQALVELDRPEYIAGAIEYLDRLAKPAIEGRGGDLQTFKTACHVKDIGISEYSAMTLMEEHYNPRCVPPWEYEALAVKVNSAYRNGQNPPGAHAGATTDDFQAVAPAPPSSSERTPNPFPSIAFGDCKVDLTRIDLIEDWLPQGGMTVIYGNSHVGKTFVFCDMAFHIAAGWDWMGKRTLQKPVAIVATEGGNGIQNRMAALQIKYGARLAAEGRTVADIPDLRTPPGLSMKTLVPKT